MRRNFLRGLLICLIPSAVAGLFTYMAFQKEMDGQVGFRRGIDLAGGTILVYEVDVEGMKRKIAEENEASKGKADYRERRYEDEKPDMRELAEKIKKRIDPSDLKNVVVRPVGDSRIEIILPYAGSSSGKKAANEEFAEDVRQQVKQAGVLEFRFLANQNDDGKGIEDARRMLDDPDPTQKAEIEKRAREGLPPPAPVGRYPVKTSERGDEIDVAYQWLELSPEERESLRLSNRYADVKTLPPLKSGDTVADAMARYQRLAMQRGRTAPESYTGKDRKTVSYVLYSRAVTKPVEKWSRDEFQRDKDGNVLNRTDKDGKEILGTDGKPIPLGKEVEYFVLTRLSDKDALKVTGEVRLEASYEQDSDKGPAVGFRFNGRGAQRFGEMCERNKPTDSLLRNLAVVMDSKVVSAPTLNAVLSERGQIAGNFSPKSANRLVSILKSGNLNADLKPEPVSTNAVGATLGESTIRRGLLAVGGSFAAVLAFMVVYYRFAGFVACVALFINLLLTVGFMVAVNAAFTLPGLAGLVLMLGMAVDANVLIYERIREEREKGATLVGAIRNGYDRALPTIIDTHLTSIFTAIVLYTFGNDNLKGFSVSLTLGLLISLFTSLYVTRLMFDFWTHKKWLSQLKMMKLFARPTFDFMRVRNLMFAATAASSVLGLALFLARGEKSLNVDFTQGTVYGGRLVKGQERGLGTTGDGKLGLLDLLAKDRQDQRLKVKDVVWESKPADGTTETKAGDNYYRIVYEDAAGKTTDAAVTLANKPVGDTEADQLADLKARAAHLPDTSVEQVFLKDDAFEMGKSASFTIRTTEKEPELVQVMLDRLLRDEKDGGALLTTTRVTATSTGVPAVGTVPENKAAFTITLDQPVSAAYFKRFVVREVRLKLLGLGSQSSTADITATGVKNSDPVLDGEESKTERYRNIRVDLSSVEEFKRLNSKDTLAGERADRERDMADVVAAAKKAFEERPAPDRLEVFDPALAASTRDSALFAIIVSWIAILAFLWFRFGSWTFGLAAVLCLVHDLCFTLGAIAICHYIHDTSFGALLGLQDFKIDLAAVAALLTLVGYSVNDTIVVFDRIREVRGKSAVLTTQMINDSVNQTLSRTILAALTVFLVVVVLYIWGGEGVHLFAFVMVMGVLVGTYSSIYIAAPLLLIFGEGKPKVTTGLGGATPPPSASEAVASAMAT